MRLDDHDTRPEPTPRWRRLPARRSLTLALATTAVLALGAVGAIAGSSLFADVDAGSTHEEGIGWMAESGVTAGCAGGLYCPDDDVNRAQMATFMYRLAGQADGVDPSVNAAELEGSSLEDILAAALAAAEAEIEAAVTPQYWAVVEADETSTELARGSGATSASGGVGTAGRFTVTFEEDVSACNYQATADVDPDKDHAVIAAVRPGPTDQSVDVWVTYSADNVGWVNTGFHLLVTC